MRILACAAALLSLSVFAAPTQADDSIWELFAPGYYVETDEEGSANCSRPEGSNWFYLHPERRPDATIPGVFSSFMGWMAFSFNGNEEDYFLEGLDGFGFGLELDESQRQIVYQQLDGFTFFSVNGVGLSGGGLGYTTSGDANLYLGVHIDTGEIRVYEAEFSDYGPTRQIVYAGYGEDLSGSLLDGRELRFFAHCSD